MEGWKDGRMEGWKKGGRGGKGWKGGRMEGWVEGWIIDVLGGVMNLSEPGFTGL